VIRAFAATIALAAAVVLVALAFDVGRWRHAEAKPATLVDGAAEALLGTGDDIALRGAVQQFVAAEATPYGFDNGGTQTRVRARAQARLADVAARTPARDAAQAYDLLGVLAWGAATAPPGVQDPADQAVGAFTTAARLAPSDTDAKFNVEVALRALETSGTRRGPNTGSGQRGAGSSGAGAGTPGEGY